MLIDEIIAKIHELIEESDYDFIIRDPRATFNPYYSRFTILARKAIKLVLKEHEPYECPEYKPKLNAYLVKVLMRVYNHPFELERYADEIERLYNLAKYCNEESEG